MGHGGVYEVDGARQARAECRGRRTQFFFHPMGAGAPATPPFSFPLGFPVASLCRRKGSPRFFAVMGRRSATEQNAFSDSDRPIYHTYKWFYCFCSRFSLHELPPQTRVQ